jgi:ABC-type sugar transport system permease subunit
MLLAGLQSIPEQIYEASKIDGATRLQTLFRITLPLLRPIIFISLLLRIIWTFNFFDLIWILTRGGPGNATTIPPILAYTMAFLKYNFGQSAAILVLMLAILVGIVTIYFKLLGEEIR